MSSLSQVSAVRRFRNWLRAGMLVLLLLTLAAPGSTLAGTVKTPKVDHPLLSAHIYTTQLRCVNCGMKLNMWARTRHAFTLSDGEYQVCSLHCVAEMARQKKEAPKNVKVAIYLEPATMIDAGQASYVVGSTAAGTMTAVSEIAFATQEAARNFAAEYGGRVMTFAEALAKADAEL